MLAVLVGERRGVIGEDGAWFIDRDGRRISLRIRAHGGELGSDVAEIEIEVLSIMESGGVQGGHVISPSPGMSIWIDDAMTKSSANLASATAVGPQVAIQLRATRLARATRRARASKLVVEVSGALYGHAPCSG